MFDKLTQRMGGVFDRLRGKGALREDDIIDALRDLRIALLEADVALPVAKAFIERVKAEAIGEKVLRSVTPGQQVIKIIYDELVTFLSDDQSALNLNASAPIVYLMAGLQGSGKTTTAGKLAAFLKNKENKKILLASTDIYRPAAREQLDILAKQAGVDALPIIADETPLNIAKRAYDAAKKGGYDLLIVDTAGRLSIDEKLMAEIKEITAFLNPTETLLVLDALTGQDAVNTAQNFNAALPITGVILTRMDSDAKGGAVLSMRAITGKPIKFLGMGEQQDALQAFDPVRIADRLLDKGDIVALVEKAMDNIDRDEAMKTAQKMQKGKFDLDDLLSQLRQMKRMGGMGGIMGMLPGMGKIKSALDQLPDTDKMLGKQEAIILAMTKSERANPDLLNASRRKRIAAGAGATVQDVNQLMKQFMHMQGMMKKMNKGGMKGMMQAMGGMFGTAAPSMAEMKAAEEQFKNSNFGNIADLGPNPFADTNSASKLLGANNPFANLSTKMRDKDSK